MIEPFQVWLADLRPVEGHEQDGVRPVVVVSSEFHLRINVGRMATVLPVTSRYSRLDYRVGVLNHRAEQNWVMTDQIRTISTSRFERNNPWWTLKDYEIENVQRALRHMLSL